MKREDSVCRVDSPPKSEYSVEFECISTFLAYFEDVAGLTERQIIGRGLKIAEATFGRGGSLTVERSSNEGSYALVAKGVDAHSARIMGQSIQTRPVLRLVKLK